MPDLAYIIREAAASDVPRLLELAQSAQDKLARIGSTQQIMGYVRQNMDARIGGGELYVLETREYGIFGSAFVEPATPERFPQVVGWNVAPVGCPVWFLYGLVVDPDRQGQGWGRILLNSICRQPAFLAPAVLVLDCWVGNVKLRRFYTDVGFHLHGEFPEEDYQIAVFRWIDRSL